MNAKNSTSFVSRFAALGLALSLSVSACTKSDDGDDSSPVGPSSPCEAIGLNPRIINGTECTSESQSPVVRLLLQFSGSESVGLCTGTMITATKVLTAAHCFDRRPSVVTLNVNNRNIPVKAVSVHPRYRTGVAEFGVQVAFNDVAVLELSTAPGLPTLPILISRDVEVGDAMAIYGYGLDEDGELGTLRAGQTSIDNVTRDHIVSNFSGNESNSCEGDSGGPGTLFSEEGTAVIAVVSGGTVKACTSGDLAVYTNVQSPDVINFIQDEAPDARIF